MVGEKAIKKIKANSKKFKEIRKRMDATPAVGLGVLPFLHTDGTVGCLVSCRQWHGYFTYTNLHIMSSGEDRLVVTPDYAMKHPHIVSIYSNAHQLFYRASDKLSEYPDIVIQGVFAHEIAHWTTRFRRLDSEIRDGMEDIRQYIAAQHKNRYFAGEVCVSLIASRYGFKEEILETERYLLWKIDSEPSPLATKEELRKGKVLARNAIKYIEKYS